MLQRSDKSEREREREMNRNREPCRNFQRGSCQYGERCKFLHVTQQQPKPNPFGFGQADTQSQHTNQQQQKPNPIRFGAQNNSQYKGPSDIGAKNQNQFKPFENKWTRFSPIAGGNSAPSRQADNQPQVPNHNCADPESCKRLIAEDFEHERPLWKLTCYGHWKYRPCDIVGDISYEELRAAAYDDAKQGLDLLSIVERERNLLNSKLIEFENLLRNPYVVSPNTTTTAGPIPFPGSNVRTSPVAVQNNLPPSVSSFGQLGVSVNLGSSNSQPVPSNSIFGQPSPFQISSQASGGLGMSSLTFGSQGFLGAQQPMQQLGSTSTSNIPSFGKSVGNTGNNPFSVSLEASQFSNSASVQSPIFSSGPNATTSMVGRASMKAEGNTDIWLMEKWNPGEIPEEEPPAEFV